MIETRETQIHEDGGKGEMLTCLSNRGKHIKFLHQGDLGGSIGSHIDTLQSAALGILRTIGVR